MINTNSGTRCLEQQCVICRTLYWKTCAGVVLSFGECHTGACCRPFRSNSFPTSSLDSTSRQQPPLRPVSFLYRMQEQIQNLWDVLDIGTATTEEVFETKVYDLLPANPAYSHYMGSLTTPPCTEVGVGFHDAVVLRLVLLNLLVVRLEALLLQQVWHNRRLQDWRKCFVRRRKALTVPHSTTSPEP